MLKAERNMEPVEVQTDQGVGTAGAWDRNNKQQGRP